MLIHSERAKRFVGSFEMILKLADPEREKHLKYTILTNPKASGILSAELSC